MAKECGTIAKELRADTWRDIKPDGSIVTHADQQIERFLRERLPALEPDATIWGEEEGYSPEGAGGLWAIDPIDGTSNYAFGSPLWGISIALIRGNDIVAGCIELPDLGETYSAAQGLGASVNGVPLPCIPPGEIKDEELVSYSDTVIKRFTGVKLPGKMRYAGAFVVEAAFFARQYFRAMIGFKANVYDVAASVVIARELGADVRFADGSSFDVAELVLAHSIGRPFLIVPSGCTLRF